MDFLLMFFLCLGIYLVAVFIFFLVDRFSSSEETGSYVNSDEYKQNQLKHTQEMMVVDENAYEEKYGFKVPKPLLEFLCNYDLHEVQEDFYVSKSRVNFSEDGWFVQNLYPINKRNLSSPSWPDETDEFYSFASEGDGDVYQIDPKDRDPMVIYFDYKTLEKKETGINFSEFLSPNMRYSIDELDEDSSHDKGNWFSESKVLLIALAIFFIAFPMFGFTVNQLIELF